MSPGSILINFPILDLIISFAKYYLEKRKKNYSQISHQIYLKYDFLCEIGGESKREHESKMHSMHGQECGPT